MIDENFNRLYELLKEDKKDLKEYRKENNSLMREQTEAIVRNTSIMEEVKISLQTKPCINQKEKDKINNGWEKYHVGVMRWIVVLLIVLLAGVLTAVGLYSSPTIPHI